jgi:hypothetical protein
MVLTYANYTVGDLYVRSKIIKHRRDVVLRKTTIGLRYEQAEG